MNKGSIYGHSSNGTEPLTVQRSTESEIRKGFRRFFEKRGIDIDAEYSKPQAKPNHEPRDDYKSHMKAVSYGRSMRKKYGKKEESSE